MSYAERHLNPTTDFVLRSLPMGIHRNHTRVSRKGAATVYRSSLILETRGPGDDGVARQRALVGHSSDDQQRSDDLFVASVKNPAWSREETKRVRT